MENKSVNLKKLLVVVAILFALNIIGNFLFHRFDLTSDNRYTLSETSFKIIKNINAPLYVDVYLEGNFPGEFKKLQSETAQLLNEYKAYNSNIIVQFINPLENEKTRDSVMQKFASKGMLPINVTLEDKGKQTQEMVFPWAVITYDNKEIKVPLLKNSIGKSTAEKVNSSVQHLEYAFANAFQVVTTKKSKKIAIIKGNGELEDVQIADFLKSVRDNYGIGPFTLDSVAKNPIETLKYLKKYDLAIIAKPTEAFSEQEKQVLDQYIVSGGKTIWLLDHVKADMEDLYNPSGATVAVPRSLNLDEMFFKYGIRIKPYLVKDIMSAPISLATGKQGSETQYTQFPWLFSPMAYPDVIKSVADRNPITSNVDGVKFEFANPIEGLKNNIDKTILLHTSQMSRTEGTPLQINLNMVSDRPNPNEFKSGGFIPVAVLLEGKFNSAYQNRVLPFKDNSFLANSKNSKMIVISDGDLIRNQVDKEGRPLELGFDKWTNNTYGNKEFLMNCTNYLLDDNGLIYIRNKDVNLPLLNKEKVYENYTKTQFITIGLPLLLLAILGFVFTFLRKRKYTK